MLFRAEMRFLALFLAFCLGVLAPANGAELKRKTAEAFERYVERTEIRIKHDAADPEHFLYFDSLPAEQKQTMLARLHAGQVVIQPMRTPDGKEIEVPDGLVHHWLALGFLPGATREQVLQLAHDYERQPKVYAPDVQRAAQLSHEDAHDEVQFRFYRQAIVTAVYDVEFRVDYGVPDSTRAYSWSHSVKIVEVQNAGKGDEKHLPEGKDRGYLWRLNLYTSYLEQDGGVYLQIEFLALSRTVPAIFAWLVNPYIRSVPRDYLTHYVVDTDKALKAENGKAEVRN